MKESITKSEYYQLLGLKVLADKHMQAVKDIVESLCKITGEDDDCGHCSDTAYGCNTIDEMLAKLHLVVA